MLKIGIAGFRHGHIYSLYDLVQKSERVALSGAWEENEAAKKDAEENHGISFNYATYEDMLNDPTVDIIGIGNYYGARGQMVIAALKAGKHVITDKPLCTSLAEWEEIRALHEKTGLSVGIMLDLRQNKNIIAAKKIVEDGLIGDVHNVFFGGQHPLFYGTRPSWYFEDGKHGGVINDIAIDVIPYVTGLAIKDVIGARCWNAYADKEPAFRDSAQLMLSLENGAGVLGDVSYAIPNSIGFKLPYYWQFQIWGKDGMMAFSAESDGVALYRDGETEVCRYASIDATETYLDAFLDEVEGKHSSMPTAEMLHSAKTALLIQKAADER